MQRNPVKEMRFPASLSEVTTGIQAGIVARSHRRHEIEPRESVVAYLRAGEPARLLALFSETTRGSQAAKSSADLRAGGELPYFQPGYLRSNAVVFDDATVVDRSG